MYGEKEKQRKQSAEDFISGNFQWRISKPILCTNPDNLPPSPDNPWVAVKDPSIVHYNGNWHLFCTFRKQKCEGGQPLGCIRIGYTSFANWKDAQTSKWRLLTLSQNYHAAPQVFFFTHHKKWYLIYQLEDKSRNISYGPCYSTTDDITKPDSWTLPAPLYASKPNHVPAWLDFWIISDQTRMHLFFTSLDGQMWRSETKVKDFPEGFGRPEVVLRADIFEASHTYRLKGLDKYLTVVEAQSTRWQGWRRYYKAYFSDRLDGQWKPLAATKDKPFASLNNSSHTDIHWTDSISHGELIRDGYDQNLEVDPANLQFLFQGLSGKKQKNQEYRNISWQLGMLTLY
ncbi:MAG: hypothetical protein MRK02_03485 [Candidatus Scalindua sp.]|nr:hypothetical protein [Candidatus Scalindua sp.]